MALISKIRKNMWLVIVLLALALAGFIIMDMTSGNNGGGFGQKTTIGEVNGEKIDYMEFQRTEEALYGNTGDPFTRKQSLWNYYVENAIVNEIAEDNGLSVGADELNELEFGTNLSPMIQSFFRDPQTGQVDRNQLNEVKKAIDEGTVSNPEFASRFNEIRKQVIKSQKQSKLTNLVSKALYTPTWYAEAMDKLNNETASFEYVQIPFDKVQDSEITVTDEDYAAYIKENPVKYTNKEEVRNVAYLVFDVKATKEDSLAIYNKMVAEAANFKAATNDSLFAVSKNGSLQNSYAKKDALPATLKDQISTLAIGDVVGPYIDNGTYQVAKLVGKKVEADSAKASHILRSVANNDPVQLAAAQKYIDSLKTAIQSGSVSFADAATANSQDPGSAAKGGDLGSFPPGAMVPQFNDAVFNGTEGSMYTVTTQFGVHLIKVGKLIYKTNEMKYKVAYINEPIVPSEATQGAVEDKVTAILEKTKTIEDLNKLATGDMKVEIAGGLKQNDFTLGTLGSDQNTRDIIRWAFDEAEVGQVSPQPYTFNDEKFYYTSKHVIAALKSIDKAGLASVESAKSKIETLVKNKKKGEKIKSKITGNDLNLIASTFATKVDTASNVSFGTAMLNAGAQEPVFIGKVFKSGNGAFVGPVIGNAGVFVAKLNSKTPAASEGGAFGQKMQLTQQARMPVGFSFMETLKKTKKIKDNRFTFF
jgi:peptidyl-prolyl cis-trans isomerase D